MRQSDRSFRPGYATVFCPIRSQFRVHEKQVFSVTPPKAPAVSGNDQNARPAWIQEVTVPALSAYAYQVGRSLVLANRSLAVSGVSNS